ncbi:MAG: TonB-dependent receptor [Algicola sp.]|nr:TonB-dependent receptor [Algicola sp.]
MAVTTAKPAIFEPILTLSTAVSMVTATRLIRCCRRINGDGNPFDSVLTSGTGGPGTYQQAILDAQGNYLSTSGDKVADPNCEAAGGILKNGLCRHSFADQLSVIPEEQRFQLFFEGEYDLSDQARVYTELSYSKNDVNATISPQLFRNGLADGNILIRADHPFNFFVSDGAGGIEYVDPAIWNNDIHTAVDLDCSCRPLGIEFNGYDSEFDREIRLNYLRSMTGFEYQFDNDWFLDTSFTYSRATRKEREGYNYKKAQLNAALDAGRFNPFGSRTATPDFISPKDGVSVAGLSRDVLMDFMHFRQSNNESEQSVVDVIVGGDWLALDGGPIGVAMGSQYRKDKLVLKEDPLWAAGLSRVPETTDEQVGGSEDVVAVFGEMLLPVTTDIELTAAIRYENYGGGIGATTDPKVTARWQASSALAFRSSYGTSFQAPSVSQASSSNGQAFLNDPASMNSSGNIVCQSTGLTSNTTVIVQGDPSLKPQTAKNFNGGLIYNRSGFEMSIDYWRFDYQNLIRPDGSAQSIVDNDCADGAADDPRIVRSASGQIRSVTLSFINTGDVVTDGLDFMVGYRFTDSPMGRLGLKLAASYVNKFALTTENIDGSTTVTHGAGSRNFSNPFSSVPRWRGNLGFNWEMNNHSANMAVRYISSYSNDQLSVPEDIASWVSLDLGYSYDLGDAFGENTRLNIGVNNIMDREPPTLGEFQRPGYDANVHEIRGRTAYVGLKVSM